MKKLTWWLAAGLFWFSLGAFAQVTRFDADTGLLTLPAVKVGTLTYTGVRFGLVNPIDYTFSLQTAIPQTPPDPADAAFDASAGVLSIPVVEVGTKVYVDVRLQIADPATHTFRLSAARLQQPSLSRLSFSPQAIYTSPTPVNIFGQVSFSAPDGDLSAITLAILNSAGTAVSAETVLIPGIAGMTSGTIQGFFTAAAQVPDRYTFRIYATDAKGGQTNAVKEALHIARFPWTRKQASPTARVYAAAAPIGGRLMIVGGRTGTGTITGHATAIAEIYEPATDTWTTAPPMPTPRMGLVATEVGGRVYAIGGTDDHGNPVGTVEVFDPVAQTWAARTPMPTPRSFAAGALVGGRIVIVGGGGIGPQKIVEAYDPATDSWTRLASLPTARSKLAVVASNGRLYAIGGYADFSLPQWLGTMETYDPVSGVWTTQPSIPTARSHLALVAVNDILLAAGGQNVSRGLAVLEVFSLASNAWSVKTASPVAFTGAATGVVDGKMYVFDLGLTLEYDPANEIL